MKSPFSTLAFATVSLAFALASVSCETTGNPREGGLFWSESKAQGRLDERQKKLDDVQGQTRDVESSSAQTQKKINAYQ